MRIAICEDNANDRALLRGYIEDYLARHSYAAEVVTFSDGESLLKAFLLSRFDLLLLDIYLPGMSGLSLAGRIRETDPYCKLMFITTSKDFMAEGYMVQTSGYVVKPIEREKMDASMTIFYSEFQKSSRLIEAPVGREGTVKIPVASIEYAEVFRKSTVFHMHDKAVETSMQLSEAEDLLGGEPFLRCHRSYIVNMNHVKDIGSDSFLMKNGGRVPMPTRNRSELRLTVTGFLAGRSLNELPTR